MVVHGTASGLDDENIFASYRVLDLAAGLSDRKLAKYAVSAGNSEHVAYGLRKRRVGVPGEDNDVPNHLGDLLQERRCQPERDSAESERVRQRLAAKEVRWNDYRSRRL